MILSLQIWTKSQQFQYNPKYPKVYALAKIDTDKDTIVDRH